jgi:hypothetical protein
MHLHRAIAGRLVSGACAALLAACGGGSGAGGSPTTQPMTTGLTDTALVSDGVIAAAHADSNLQNGWGLAAAPGGPFWVADNNSNKATIYDGNGNLVKRFASGGVLNAPWGIALATPGFGFAGAGLQIGNFGDGMINRFDPASGQSLGSVSLASGNQLVIPGLWALAFGNGAASQPTNALFYTAGPNNETDGVFGRIDVVTSSSPPPCTGYGC